MSLLLVACGAIALVLPGLRPASALRGHPHWFTLLHASALALGLASVALGLALSVAVGAIHVVSGTSLLRYGGHLAPGGIVLSALSSLLLMVIAWRVRARWRTARRGRRLAEAERWFVPHERLGDHDVVLLPTAVPLAYGIPSSPPQIVISEGLRERLDNDLIGFVIDHERAHLRRRHRRYLLLAVTTDALLGAVPAVARSTLMLRLAVERAADEEAAGPDRARRNRLAVQLQRLSRAGLTSGCSADALMYRAQRLLAPQVRPAARVELVAASGLLALAVATLTIALHATGDVPTLLATLHR